MSVFVMVRGWMLRRLASRGNRWWFVPVLTAPLLGVIGGAANAATSTVTPTGVGSATPVLRQAGSKWDTTVLVTGTARCAKATVIQYWLSTTPLPGPTSPGAVIATAPDGDACEVTVAFSGLAQVPVTAALVVDQSGTSTSVALTVSRDVALSSYLGWPAIAGGIAVGLYMLFLLSVTTYDWQGTKRWLINRAWWKHPIAGSGAWSAGDSWATNISTGLVVVGTVLAVTTASSTLFPGVALDRFAIVNILAGVFVVAAPLLFAILYVQVTGRRPGLSADSVIKVPPGKQVVLRVPSGASMTMVTETTVTGVRVPGSLKGGDSLQIAPGSEIAITPPDPADDAVADLVGIIALSGTSDIGVLPGASVHVVCEQGTYEDAADTLFFNATLMDGAKITVTGTADVNLPEGALITGPRRNDKHPVKKPGRWLLVPQGSTVIVGNLCIMVAANVFTMFGIGAEIGIAFVLARLSEATGAAANGIYAGLATLACFVLWYAVNATRAMSNPQPGSALSAQAGTSFTL